MARCKGAVWLVFSGCSTFGNRCRFFIALRLDGRKTFHRKVFSSPFRIPCRINKKEAIPAESLLFLGALQGIRTPGLLVRRGAPIVELHSIWWNPAEFPDKSSVQETKRSISASVDMLRLI